MAGFLNRGWKLILSGCGGTSVLARGETLAALAQSAPANQQSASEVGISRPRGAVSTRAIFFSSPGCWSCRGMEGFIIRGVNLFLPVRGGISTLA